MLKSDKLSTPYISLANNSLDNGPHCTTNQSNTRSTNQNGGNNLKESTINSVASNGVGNTLNNGQQQKVTRRVAHEICEKRKMEEQEFEISKRVKTEGDASELLIKQLVKQVETEFSTNENDVIKNYFCFINY